MLKSLVVSSCWAWTAYSLRSADAFPTTGNASALRRLDRLQHKPKKKKKKKQEKKKKLSPVHFGSFISTHCPRIQERISFPSNIYPSRQRYLALERRMFMLMIVFFGGFLRRRRSILSQLVSRSAAII